ncbi:MAG: hypothetical protein K6E29_01545 [Cyanobacteria bacterium RUI128]|nr:hypothetical protein [Cyanobacteria bacterium RUI128]
MVSNVSGNPNNLSGIGIYCNNIDVSKLSKEERDRYLEKMPNCTVVGPGGACYPAGYYMNNYAGNTVKKRVQVLTDRTIEALDKGLESQDQSIRLDTARSVVKLFGEDVTRYKDEGLNVLLNKMLINPYDKKIRSYALNLLTTQMAKGNDETKAILEALKEDPHTLDRHKGDAELALIKMQEDVTIANVPTNGNRVIL